MRRHGFPKKFTRPGLHGFPKRLNKLLNRVHGACFAGIYADLWAQRPVNLFIGHALKLSKRWTLYQTRLSVGYYLSTYVRN